MELAPSKACSKCGCVKPLEDFPNKRGSKDGNRGQCKGCFGPVKREAFRRWRLKYPNKSRETWEPRPSTITSLTKTCSKCKQTKPLEDFPNRPASRDGKRGQCKVCMAPTMRRNAAMQRQKHINRY